jgi:hypothetical protein
MGLVWDSGHTVDGQYVPKKPNYKFKDKGNNIVPSNLDTVHVYREVATYSGGMLLNIRSDFYLLKFYPNGRVLQTRNPRRELEALQMSYQEVLYTKDMYVYAKHGYYYSEDGEKIQTEEFVNTDDTWPVAGMYQINNYHLNATGDTLTMQNPKSDFIMIYVKEKLPRVLEDYPVTW